MLLLDSLYVNNSGGKVILNYLIENLEKTDLRIHYLIDERMKGNHPDILKNEVTYLKASLISRHLFYRKFRLKFSRVLCFGNLPPTIKMTAQVFTYFHQPLFLDIPSDGSIVDRSLFFLKTLVLKALSANTKYWVVQSDLIKGKLSNKYHVPLEDIKIYPFYPPLKSKTQQGLRRKDGFAYISNGGIHKNHRNLIEGFCMFFDHKQHGVLHLTISNDFPEIQQLIDEKIKSGYPIVNHGFVSRDELVDIYNSIEYLIFPSLAESFGLGIIEAIESGCKVLAANRPYIYQVCNPSIVFDPLNVDDIKHTLCISQEKEIKMTEPLISNKIVDLLAILTH